MTMPTVQHPKSVLYFPTIEFQDESWLRASLCVWDRVERIVPAGYKPRDSSDVRALLDAGLVRAIDLSKADIEGAAKSYEDLLAKAECKPAALDVNSEAFSRLHKGKVGERLHKMFRAISNPLGDRDDWFGVPRSVCHGYMSHLAEVAARRRGMAKVTDNKDSFAVAPFFDTDGMLDSMGYDPGARYAHAVLALTTVVPAAARDMPVSDLIAFRNRTQDGRAAMAIAIDRLASDIAKIEDPGTAKERLAAAATDFQRSRELIAKQSTYSTRELANAALCAGMGVGLTAVGAFAAAGADPFTPLSLLGGSAIALVASMAQAYSTRKQIPVDPVRSYYVQMECQGDAVFRPRCAGRGNDFYAVMEEFIND